MTQSAFSSLGAICSTSPVHYIVSGSFKSTVLYLLAFDPLASTLHLAAKIPAHGPHQYLALIQAKDRLYTTTWADPPSLHAWSIDYSSNQPLISLLNAVPITATSSYTSVFENKVYSAGGPTGEVHSLSETGAFDRKIEELYYVHPSKLPQEDKTRKALRYGSHGIDIAPSIRKAFVPHLGHNSIWMYDVRKDGSLEYLNEIKSPREADGPRHVITHPNGKYLYSVTEHTSMVDIYKIKSATMTYISSHSIVPPNEDSHNYRGDTLRFSSTHNEIFATTRGQNADYPGFLTVFALKPDGLITSDALERWRTPTYGGKANAVDVYAHAPSGKEWITLTDDSDDGGFVSVLEWNGQNIKELARCDLESGSHALWL